MKENIKDIKNENENSQFNQSANRLIHHLREIRDICRNNEWYASATYSSMAADSLFHMLHLGDKAQRPDMMVTLTDVHYSAYPDELDESELDQDTLN